MNTGLAEKKTGVSGGLDTVIVSACGMLTVLRSPCNTPGTEAIWGVGAVILERNK